ncbi:MAG: GDP-mannose 4,6-dehydratase, partial [Acetobacter sp.]|nr:GDP-mannose 4,6-dehydratase [Acetobacter sp.]
MTFLVTGCCGFIGYHVTRALLERGDRVIGVDNMNAYYSTLLKEARLEGLQNYRGFEFYKGDINTEGFLEELLDRGKGIKGIFHLAAQAGVRFSLEDPYAFIDANVKGHVKVLEFARRLERLEHLVYASSSSVYGRNTKLPFSEEDPVDQPASIYAMSKRSGELASFTYSYVYGLPQTGLRFFTVYGPFGRPDMAYYSFAHAIARGATITLYDGGKPARDFTYISDVVDAILRVFDYPPPEGGARVLNIGNDKPESVGYLVSLLERFLNCKAQVSYQKRPNVDIERSWADIRAIRSLIGWTPKFSLEEGIERFVQWYQR